MENSILEDIREIVGPGDPTDNTFDKQLIIATNLAFAKLNQLGVGPRTGFSISNATAKWDDFEPDIIMKDLIKSYVVCIATINFDPPRNSFLLDSLRNNADELEWRLKLETERSDI